MDELPVRCPSCETDAPADVLVSNNCFHVYRLPIFPFEKEADIICKRCGGKRYGRSFNQSLMSNFQEIKNRFYHPLLTYTGAAVMAFVCLLMVFATLSH